MGGTLAEIFSEFAMDQKFDSLPDQVKYFAKFFVLDHIGCVLGGSKLSSSQIMLKIIEEIGGKRQASVLGHNLKTSMPNAALVNATMGHGLEMDDDHRVACMHPGVPVIPAALATSEGLGKNGKTFLLGAALGLEAMIRIGEAFLGASYKQGFHPTGTCGVFGAAVAASKIMGLNREKTLNAIGIAGSQAAGLREARAQGTWGKRFQAGHPSMCGVLSALMARKGFTGPASIFEGEDGFLRAYSYKNQFDGQKIINGLGNKWEMLDTSIKVHACCRFAAPIIDCTLDIVKSNEIDVESIEEIMASSSTIIIEAITIPKERKIRPKTIVDAQFSLPYCVAVAIRRKKAFIDEFTEKAIKDSKTLEIIPKIKWKIDPEDDKNYPQFYSARVTIKMKNGKEFTAHVNYPKGDPENAVSKGELENKFRSLSEKAIGKEKASKVISKIWNLEKMAKMSEVTGLLRGRNH